MHSSIQLLLRLLLAPPPGRTQGGASARPLAEQVGEFFSGLLDPKGFPARWHCGQWTDFHGWLYIVSDLLIWSAYFAIPFLLLRFIGQRRDVPFNRLFWLFGLFIFACGATHLLDALIFWLPLYRLNGLLLLVTAVASWGTVWALVGVLPKALLLKTPTELERIVKARTTELAAANQQLTRANTDLANFIYTASHDLKTPIANIEGLLELLRMQLPPADGNEMVPRVLTMMQQAIERFQFTITQLTDITRLQQANAQPAEPVDLATLVEDIRLDLSRLIASTNATITVDVAACPTVSFAPKNLRSIMYNLLSNGIKYHAPDRAPVVQLRARHDADARTTVLEVQDNGLGLRPEQQNKLFGMFKRLHDHVEGTGIGLYMVNQIVENVGGTITVQSQLGVGTTFVVTLPG